MTRLITLVMSAWLWACTAFASPASFTVPADALKADLLTSPLGNKNSAPANTNPFSLAEADNLPLLKVSSRPHFFDDNNAMADVNFNLTSATGDVGTQVCLDVSVAGFTDIATFQYSINWDETYLSYVGVQNLNLTDLNAAAFGDANVATGALSVSWFHNATTGVTVADGTVIYQICFDILAGAEGQNVAVTFTGNPTAIEVTDNTSQVQTFVPANGQINVNGTPDGGGGGSEGVTFSVSSATANVGEQTCLDVSVEGFTDITSFQYSMNWNEGVLDYVGVQNTNLTDLNAAAFGTSGTDDGNLTLSWFHNAATGVTVPDGTVIYQVCFEPNIDTEGQTAAVVISGSPTSTEVTDNTGSVVDFSQNNGQISVNGTGGGGGSGNGNLIFTLEDISAEQGDMICLDVTVENFTDLVTVQYSMLWNPEELAFTGIQNFNLVDLNASAFGTSGTDDGNLTLSWFHNATTGVTLSDDTAIYQVCFEVLSGTDVAPLISFVGSPTAIEIIDNQNNQIPFFSNPGQVTVTNDSGTGGGGGSENVTFSVESMTAQAGTNICLDVTVDNYTDILTWQYSVTWNPSVLSYTGVTGFNLPGLAVSSFGGNTASGTLTASWDDATAQGVTVANGTAIYQICFDVIGSNGSSTQVQFGGSPTAIEVTGGAQEVLDADFNAGTVTVQGDGGGGGGGGSQDVTFSIESMTAQAGTNICLDVTVDNYTDILTWQYSITWDPTVISYTGVTGFNLPGLAVSSFGGNTAIGTLTASWDDATAQGVTVANGTVIYQICFDVIGSDGSSAQVQFGGSPTAIEVTGGAQEVLDADFNAGTVTVGAGCNAINITQTGITNLACNGVNTGAINVSVTGGDGNFSYQWINTDSGSLISTQQNVSGLAAGNYTLNVSSCGGTGTQSQTFQITQPAPITINETIGNIACFGNQNGSISVTGQGGTGTLSYAWTGGNLSGNTTGSTLSGLIAGNYTLTVTDANNCTYTETFTVTASPALTATSEVNDVSCNGENDGAILITPQGGNGGFTYQWTGGLTGNNPTGVTPGTYSVTVTDAEGCETILNDLTVNEPAVLTVTGAATDVATGQTGSVEITVQGGTSGYTFAWSGPQGYSSSSEDITGLTVGGEYCVTVSDANACTVTQCFTVASPLTLAVEEVQPSCAGESNGFINLNTSGGQGVVTYAWTYNGAAFGQTTEDITGLAGGTYVVTATDAEGTTATLTVELDEAEAALSVTPVVSQLSAEGQCDGAINVSNVTGGFGGYTYLWNEGQTTAELTALCAGTYSVTITDSEGCSTTETFVIQFIEEPLNATVAVSADVSCFGECDGTIQVTVATGVPPFTTEVFDADGALVGSVFGAELMQVIDNLCAQNYSVTITDGTGQQMTVTDVMIDEPEELLISSATVFPVTTAGGNEGAISITVTGGTQPYSFQWSNGSVEMNITDLPVGSYTVTVTDVNGCAFSETYNVEFFQFTATQINDVNCVGDLTGEVCVNVTGGNGEYTYLWSNGANTACITNAAAGEYTVTVTDTASGVSITRSATINTLSDLAVTADASTVFTGGANISCAGRADGAATAVTAGGAAPYSYAWSNGDTAATITDLTAGTYTVTVTDAAGCVSSAAVDIIAPAPLEVFLQTDGISCTDERDGSITAVVTGGANTNPADYDYEWTGTGIVNAFLPTINNLSAGIFSVNVMDSNGCEATAQTELTNPAPLVLEAETTPDDGTGNGSVTATVSGGTEPYNYEWRSNGEVGTTPEVTGLSAGNYMLIVTDNNGCMETLTDVIVADNSLGCLDTRTVITPDNDGMNDEFVINCIEQYGDNNLEIFNRYGQLVFRQENYSCGTDDCPDGWQGVNLRGDVLPGGGYFFVLEYRENGAPQQLKGAITILRE